MRVVIVDDMLGQDDDDNGELAGQCDRCGAELEDDDATEVSVSFAGIGSAEWFWCEECADSFTAWRLARDPAPAGDSDAPRPAESGGSVGPPTAAAGGL